MGSIAWLRRPWSSRAIESPIGRHGEPIRVEADGGTVRLSRRGGSRYRAVCCKPPGEKTKILSLCPILTAPSALASAVTVNSSDVMRNARWQPR